MSNIRLSGLVSGFDTDKLISDMMKIERSRVDKISQNRQLVEWKQEAYRDIITKARDFQNKYLDILNPTSNFKSTSIFSKFNYDLKGQGDTSAISVTGKSNGNNKTITVDSVTQLATADVVKGNKMGFREVTSKAIDLDELKQYGSDLEFTLAIGASSKKITVSKDDIATFSTPDDLANAIKEQVKQQFGADFANVVGLKDGKLTFSHTGSKVSVFNFGESTSLQKIGIENGANTDEYTNQTISSLLKVSSIDVEQLKGLKFGNVEVEISAFSTIADIEKAINKSESGVKFEYNELQDRFILRSTKEGTANNFNPEAGSPLDSFIKMFMGDELANLDRQAGQNAHVKIDGVEIISSTNTIVTNNANITLNKTTDSPITINMKSNSEEILKTVKGFIDDYNALLDSMNTKINEKRNADFLPLTEEQKNALSETEVTKWEEKAKSGLLRNDSDITSMVTRIRQAMTDKLESSGVSLSDIGINTGSYSERGKLKVDDAKLKNAIENRLDDVMKVFSNAPETPYSADSSNASRYKDGGIAHRLDDILKDFTRTTRDKSGNKGILIQKAGVVGDISFNINSMNDQIKEYDKRLYNLEKQLAKKEQMYYARFAAMEKTLSDLQSQTSQLLGGLGK